MSLVLIVDDDAALREMLAEYLERDGFEVVEASNGLEALLPVKRRRPNAIVMDLMMPRLGGLEALKRIRQVDPGVVVIILSGSLTEDLRRQALALGATAVFTKSGALAELVLTLRTALERPTAHGGPPSAEPTATAEPVPVPGDPRSARVLVVDDDPEIRALLEEFLVRCGYRVSTASDGAEAIRAITATAPEIVLLDIDMPMLRGVEALPAIRGLAPETTVIMVSGTTDAALAKQALAYGAFDYVSKPIDLAYLARSIDAAVTMKGAGA